MSNKTAQKKLGKSFPSWRYGPGYVAPKDGQPEPSEHAQIFNSEADVPAGWVDHPSKLKIAAAPAEAMPAAPAKKLTKAERAAADAAATEEAKRQELLAKAREKFGGIVPDSASVAELESALNGNGS